MDDMHFDSLTSEETELWNRYVYEDSVGLRKKSLATVDSFARFVAASPERRDRFARQLCTLIVDQDFNLPLVFAVSTHLLFPTLTEAFEQGSADAARWIGGLYHRISSVPVWKSWLCDDSRLYSDVTILEEAYRRDPEHPKVQSMLIEAWWSWLSHTVHEVPNGILVGMNGATVEDCVVLRERLAAFRTLAQATDEYDYEIHMWIEHCDRWYRWYIDYLTHRDAYQSFKQYAEIAEKREQLEE